MFDAFENQDHFYESGLDLTGRHFHPAAADDRIIRVVQVRIYNNLKLKGNLTLEFNLGGKWGNAGEDEGFHHCG